jgi:hypothetical protein
MLGLIKKGLSLATGAVAPYFTYILIGLTVVSVGTALYYRAEYYQAKTALVTEVNRANEATNKALARNQEVTELISNEMAALKEQNQKNKEETKTLISNAISTAVCLGAPATKVWLEQVRKNQMEKKNAK